MRPINPITAPAAAIQSKAMNNKRYQTKPTSVTRAGKSMSQYRQAGMNL